MAVGGAKDNNIFPAYLQALIGRLSRAGQKCRGGSSGGGWGRDTKKIFFFFKGD